MQPFLVFDVNERNEWRGLILYGGYLVFVGAVVFGMMYVLGPIWRSVAVGVLIALLGLLLMYIGWSKSKAVSKRPGGPEFKPHFR